MTPDFEQKLRWFIEQFERGDFEAAVAIYSPEGVQDMSALGVGTFEGREAIREFLEDWREPYQDIELALEEVRDLGNDVTLTVLVQHARLPGSSVFLSVGGGGGGWVAVWRDGLIERNTVYPESDEARAAAERLAEERG
jgi:hypothetical protein